MRLLDGSGSEEVTELLDGETSVLDNSAHRECVDGIVARNGDDTRPVSHDDVLGTPHNSKACLFQSAHGLLVVDPRNSWHCLGDVNFADDRALEEVLSSGQILANGVLDILERLLLCRTL